MKKSTMLACAGIVIVSFSPFLSGCATNSTATEPETVIVESQSQEVALEQDASFEIPAVLGEHDAVYAKIISNNDGELVVETGHLLHNEDGVSFQGTGHTETLAPESVTYVDTEGNELSAVQIGATGFEPGSIIVVAQNEDVWLLNPGLTNAADSVDVTVK